MLVGGAHSYETLRLVLAGLDLSLMKFPALLHTLVDDGQLNTRVHGKESALKVKPLEPIWQKLFQRSAYSLFVLR